MQNEFVDTNVLLYRVDNRDPRKRDIAKLLISELGDGIITSTQVLQEFYWNATNKLRLPPSSARQLVEYLCRRKVIQVTPSIVLASMDTSERYRISFWDSLIVEAAAAAQCSVLYSEDLQHGQKIRGVRVHNPFA